MLEKISETTITETFSEHPEKSWRKAVDNLIGEAMEENDDDIKTALKEKLEHSVAQFLKPKEAERKAKCQAQPKNRAEDK